MLSSVCVGPLDDDGQPHGFCTVTYSSSDRFEGHFTHGEKNGKGKFFFFDGRYCTRVLIVVTVIRVMLLLTLQSELD